MKEKILKYVDDNYKGSLRFIKEGVLNKIDKDCIKTMREVVTDEKLHIPVSLLTYCYLNDVFTHPVCKMCGSLVKFNTNRKEFANYCSNKCRIKDIGSIQDKKRQTNIERYGTTNVLASDYGKQKSKETFLEKYGVDNYTKTQEYKDRYKSGNIKRVVDGDKISMFHRKKHYDNVICKWEHIEPQFVFDEYEGAASYRDYKWKCKKCSHVFFRWLNMGFVPECPKCKPSGTGDERFIKQFLDDNGILYRFCDRSQLTNNDKNISPHNKLEIDFYLPDYKIGIEINGLKYHHDGCKHKEYHLNKTLLAEKKGIELLHIFNDVLYIKSKREIVLSKLRSKLNLLQTKFYGRQCIVKPLNSYTTLRDFLDNNHLQGYAVSSINLGLYKDNELVAVMTFNSPRIGIGKITEDKSFELVRYCPKINTTIVGGPSKLLKYFEQNYDYNLIYTYADRCWSKGDMYYKLGFERVTDKLIPNYWYTKHFQKRYHRSQFQKKHLKHKLDNFDPSLSEFDNMKNNGYSRFWDCGTLRFEKRRPGLSTRSPKIHS